jgi:hypothetical protein
MTDRIRSRAGDAAGHLGLLAVRGLRALSAQVTEARARAREREEGRTAALDAVARRVEEARVEIDARLPAALAAYRPEITQAALDAVSRETPWAAAELLGRERMRIVALLRAIRDEAGLPLPGTLPNAALNDRAYAVWEDMHRPFHAKAFSGLRLGPYFRLVDDVLHFEETYTEDTTLRKIATGTQDLVELNPFVRAAADPGKVFFAPPKPRQIGVRSGFYYESVPAFAN